MASRTLASLTAYTASGASAATSAQLAGVFSSVRLSERLGEPARLTLTGLEGGALLGVYALLTRRAIVRADFSGGEVTFWRVREVETAYGDSQSWRATLDPLWLDLEGTVVAETLASSGFVDVGVTMAGRFDDVLGRLLSTDYGAPSGLVAFTLGTLETAPAAARVFLTLTNASTLDGIRQAVTKAGAELVFTAAPGSGGTLAVYSVAVVAQSGQPTGARIMAGTGAAVNRLGATRKRDDASYFSHLAAVAEGDSPITLAGAAWPVTTATYFPGPNQTALSLGGSPIWEDGALEGLFVRAIAGGPLFEVLASEAPSVLVVAGNASALTSLLVREAGDRDLVALPSPAAGDGLRVRRQTFSVGPFSNALADAGASADFSAFTAGLPTGWTKVGTPTVAAVATEGHVRYGTSSVQVTASKDQGLISPALPRLDARQVSAWVGAYVASAGGRVRIEIIDGDDGTVHPVGQKVDSTSETLQALSIGGAPVLGATFRVRIVADSPTCTFIVDAATATRSAQPQPYAEAMGPNALWREAAKVLLEEGGAARPDAIEGRLLDLSSIATGYDEIRVGDTVTATEEGPHGFTLATRVVEVEESFQVGASSTEKRIRLSQKRADLRRQFEAAPPADPVPVVEPVRRPQPSAQYGVGFAYVAGDGAMVLLSWLGGPDVKSVRWTLTVGATTTTGTVDAPAGSVELNPAAPLAPGSTIEVRATAYSETGAAGEAEASPYRLVTDVPLLDADGYVDSGAAATISGTPGEVTVTGSPTQGLSDSPSWALGLDDNVRVPGSVGLLGGAYVEAGTAGALRVRSSSGALGTLEAAAVVVTAPAQPTALTVSEDSGVLTAAWTADGLADSYEVHVDTPSGARVLLARIPAAGAGTAAYVPSEAGAHTFRVTGERSGRRGTARTATVTPTALALPGLAKNPTATGFNIVVTRPDDARYTGCRLYVLSAATLGGLAAATPQLLAEGDITEYSFTPPYAERFWEYDFAVTLLGAFASGAPSTALTGTAASYAAVAGTAAGVATAASTLAEAEAAKAAASAGAALLGAFTYVVASVAALPSGATEGQTAVVAGSSTLDAGKVFKRTGGAWVYQTRLEVQDGDGVPTGLAAFGAKPEHTATPKPGEPVKVPVLAPLSGGGSALRYMDVQVLLRRGVLLSSFVRQADATMAVDNTAAAQAAFDAAYGKYLTCDLDEGGIIGILDSLYVGDRTIVEWKHGVTITALDGYQAGLYGGGGFPARESLVINRRSRRRWLRVPKLGTGLPADVRDYLGVIGGTLYVDRGIELINLDVNGRASERYVPYKSRDPVTGIVSVANAAGMADWAEIPFFQSSYTPGQPGYGPSLDCDNVRKPALASPWQTGWPTYTEWEAGIEFGSVVSPRVYNPRVRDVRGDGVSAGGAYGASGETPPSYDVVIEGGLVEDTFRNSVALTEVSGFRVTGVTCRRWSGPAAFDYEPDRLIEAMDSGVVELLAMEDGERYFIAIGANNDLGAITEAQRRFMPHITVRSCAGRRLTTETTTREGNYDSYAYGIQVGMAHNGVLLDSNTIEDCHRFALRIEGGRGVSVRGGTYTCRSAITGSGGASDVSAIEIHKEGSDVDAHPRSISFEGVVARVVEARDGASAPLGNGRRIGVLANGQGFAWRGGLVEIDSEQGARECFRVYGATVDIEGAEMISEGGGAHVGVTLMGLGAPVRSSTIKGSTFRGFDIAVLLSADAYGVSDTLIDGNRHEGCNNLVVEEATGAGTVTDTNELGWRDLN